MSLIAWPVIAGIKTVIGALCNLFVLIILLKFKTLRKGAGLLIIYLLTTNLLLSILAFLLYIHRIAKASYTQLDCNICRYEHPFHPILNTMTNWRESLLVLNRTAAIVLPVSYRTLNQHIYQYSAWALGWLLTLTFAIPPAADYLGSYIVTPIGTCLTAFRSRALSGLFSFMSYCPVALMALAAVVSMAEFLWKNRLQRQGRVSGEPVGSTGQQKHVSGGGGMSDRQKRLSRMLTLEFVLSVTCQLPLLVI